MCLDYSRTNEHIFIFFVGRTYPKKDSTNFWERFGSYFSYKKKKNHKFSEVLFSMYFNDLRFLLDISSKVMNKL